MSGENFSNKINPYDIDELKKYFDPLVFQNLNDLTIFRNQMDTFNYSFGIYLVFPNYARLIDNQSNIITS